MSNIFNVDKFLKELFEYYTSLGYRINTQKVDYNESKKTLEVEFYPNKVIMNHYEDIIGFCKKYQYSMLGSPLSAFIKRGTPLHQKHTYKIVDDDNNKLKLTINYIF
ncbi:MAG: hypothetical protein LBM02_08475 [Lachnospiraceae bacterium]|jgi:hypothetical protein|nr:hypothetical protein [Lachnospiraceae bacterium]